MRIVERYGLVVLKAKEVRDVHTLNRGWDLEFYYDDGRWEPIEVKGSSGIGAFMITRNEWRAARDHANYVLFHVTNLGNPSLASMRVYRRLGERLTDAHLTPLSWTVSNWLELEPEEVPIKAA